MTDKDTLLKNVVQLKIILNKNLLNKTTLLALSKKSFRLI